MIQLANEKVKEISIKSITKSCLIAWQKSNLDEALAHFNQK